MAEPMITIQELVKDYDDTRAVDHLNLEIGKGEIFGLLGPNGAGKTTIILTLLGLTEPTLGSVIIKGYNSTSQPIEVKRVTGYLPDEVGFSDNSIGLESLVYTAMLNGIPREEATKSARELLEIVGLSEAAEDKTKTYSKGMTQRLGLADVLIKKPEIMILDEPTIGIDPKGINDFLEMIRKLSKEKGITVLLCSHLLHQVQKICDRVGILVDGQLQALGDINELAEKLFGGRDTSITAEIDPITDQLVEELKTEGPIKEIHRNGETLTIKGSRDAAPLISQKVAQHGGKLYRLSYKEYGLDEIYQHYFEGGTING
ncbi:ABC transporter ATP-binding protein [Aliifodinibius sp. S!AR15-10]|uniref:ABC transporter ATP-binding protein n=1 Tax=Aliifodinibius sp. S!AR15-10 TaxID=2950437 RepID=UPI00285DA0CE|nr:ABC transporter ATP-binding protein [Aliifodinibius sp. S!AR15-10]MDR8393594.1 ABC transporter ATP-binding protein [Aliifodinibius sp. S!AR15-10]